jgi:hypothetical protein
MTGAVGIGAASSPDLAQDDIDVLFTEDPGRGEGN